jgi:hypothetical protein
VPANPYRGYRFPEEIISQCVWLYFNFAVRLRDVELMMAYRGVQLSYETIRRWCDTFGAAYAAKLKRKRPKLGDRWFLDEDTSFLLCTTVPNARDGLLHGGRPSQLEIHSAKKLSPQFALLQQLVRLRRSSPAQLDSAG